MGGIGKTSLLKTVYNAYKQGNVFQHVIWITVSQNIDILSIQRVIADSIKIDLGSSSNAESSCFAEMRKMKMFTHLKEKKFLLVLDDLWSPLNLKEQVGIPVDNKKGSKVIISTRNRDVICRMGANDYSIKIEPLSEEGWHLFCREAFNDGSALTKSIEDLAGLIAGECQGLPLAIQIVAAAVKDNATLDEWMLAIPILNNLPHRPSASGSVNNG